MINNNNIIIIIIIIIIITTTISNKQCTPNKVHFFFAKIYPINGLLNETSSF